MTPEKIRERAMYLYVVEGESCNSIAKILRDEYKTKTTAKSVQAWSKDPDQIGMTWEDRKKAVASRSLAKVEVIAEDRSVEILQRTQTVADSLYNMIVAKNAPGIKTFESAVYAFKEISKFEQELRKSRDSNTLMAIVQAMLEVFASSPQVAKVIQENWAYLSQQIQKKIMGESQ
jgi:transposase